MSTTKKKIAEQVLVALKGGSPDVASNVDIREIMEMVGQSINARLKTEYYQNLNAGNAAGVSREINAGSLMLATYQVKVNEVGDYAWIQLPCMPIHLMKNQGLHEITKPDDILGVYQFIPVPPGMWALLPGMSITSDVLGQICYVNEGLKVFFSRNIVKDDEITEVRVKLVVVDINSLSEYDPLPVPADIELSVVSDVLQMLGVPRSANKLVDISTDAQLTEKGR
jgi:hypothetical protein